MFVTIATVGSQSVFIFNIKILRPGSAYVPTNDKIKPTPLRKCTTISAVSLPLFHWVYIFQTKHTELTGSKCFL